MHSQWKEIAQQVDVSEDLIPGILSAIGIVDLEHPRPKQVEDYENVCLLVAEGQTVEAAAQTVISEGSQPTQSMAGESMATRQTVRELYPNVDEGYIDNLLQVLGIPAGQEEFPQVVLEEFPLLYQFLKSTQLKDWEQVKLGWAQFKQQPASGNTVPALQDNSAAALSAIQEAVDTDVERIIEYMKSRNAADNQRMIQSIQSLKLNRLAQRLAEEGLGGADIVAQPAGTDFLAQLESLAALPPLPSAGALPESPND